MILNKSGGAEYIIGGGVSQANAIRLLLLEPVEVAEEYYFSSDFARIRSSKFEVSTSERDMSNPMGAFAAFKVRDNMNNGGNYNTGKKEQATGSGIGIGNTTEGLYSNPPAKYNEKMMMSIWGLYNRYSVHNMKSHKDLSKF